MLSTRYRERGSALDVLSFGSTSDLRETIDENPDFDSFCVDRHGPGTRFSGCCAGERAAGPSSPFNMIGTRINAVVATIPAPPYSSERRDGYYPYPPRDAYDRDYPIWRAGDVVPGELLDFVVDDWEPRGLERPPGGHQWIRTRSQFLLVRERDRMIARIITFG